jgi:hypothetical protein
VTFLKLLSPLVMVFTSSWWCPLASQMPQPTSCTSWTPCLWRNSTSS